MDRYGRLEFRIDKNADYNFEVRDGGKDEDKLVLANLTSEEWSRLAAIASKISQSKNRKKSLW